MFRKYNLLKIHSRSAEKCLSVQKYVRFSSNKSSDEPEIKKPKPENPFKRTLRIFGDDMQTLQKSIKYVFTTNTNPQTDIEKGKHSGHRRSVFALHQNKIFPSHCDIVIIGGGIMGTSIAYWLKQRAPKALTITVLEKDPTVNENVLLGGQYTAASTTLSLGGLRQQFSLEENIKMSLFGADFIRNVKRNLAVEGYDTPDVNFTPFGYLFLATEAGAEQLQDNSKLQLELGAKNELLSPTKLKEKFPWINTDGIALGCHGLENEGWFDPCSLLYSMKRKAVSLGVDYVNAEVVGFEFKKMPDMMMEGIEAGSYEGLDHVLVRMDNGEIRSIKFAIAILAAGPQSGEIAQMARIGTGTGMLAFPLTVEPRKRYVYCFNCKNGPGLNTPLTIDPSGIYFRREGLTGNYTCGRSPEPAEEPSTDDLNVDYEYFEKRIWPDLASRVPAFESIKMNSAWAGFYEYNTFDENGIIGPHPYYNNLYIATGFSGHGIQQAPAVGRAIMEMIIDDQFVTIDLSRLSFDRIISDQPMKEQNIV